MQIVFTHCPHIYQNNFREYHTIGIYCYSVKMPPKQIFWCIDSNCKKSVLIVLILLFHVIIVDYGSILDVMIPVSHFLLPIINIVDLYNLSSMTSCVFGPKAAPFLTNLFL